MSNMPTTLSLAHKRIARLEADLADAQEAHETLGMEMGVALSNKDRESLERCKKCGRGVRR